MVNSQQHHSVEEFTRSGIFQRIGEICATVNSVASAKQLLETSLKKTMQLFDASRGSIFILADNKRDLILKIAEGMEIREEESLVKRIGEGVVGRVAISKKPIFVNDISQDDRFLNYKARSSYRTPSFICAPLLIKDNLIGVISISDKESGKHFSANELQLLDFLSSQIALNYRRIELYEEFQSSEKEKASLKSKLGESHKEARNLKKQIVLHEKLATIGKLTGGIAHEFNNPLDGVMRYTNLCLDHVKDDEVVRGYLLEIKNGLHRMANIVKSLLACSRNGSDSPSMVKINLNNCVEQTLSQLRTELLEKNISIKKDLSRKKLELTDLGIERILHNLIRNAIDAVEPQGQIIIRSMVMDNHVVIEIGDNGSGIPEDKIQEIFEPFYTTKDIDKGCGLGLTIVTEIVKSYDGQINVESRTGQGTTFSVILPLRTSYES